MQIPFYEWSNIEKKLKPYVKAANKGLIAPIEVIKVYDDMMAELKIKYNKQNGE